jgi:hypothetical protein
MFLSLSLFMLQTHFNFRFPHVIFFLDFTLNCPNWSIQNLKTDYSIFLDMSNLIIMGLFLLAVQRCSIGAGAGVSSFSINFRRLSGCGPTLVCTFFLDYHFIKNNNQVQGKDWPHKPRTHKYVWCDISCNLLPFALTIFFCHMQWIVNLLGMDRSEVDIPKYHMVNRAIWCFF